MNFKISNIEVNLLIKIKNIFGGKGFGSRMDMFKKKIETNESSKVMTTGVSMKDRLKLFSNRLPAQVQQNKAPPKKIKPPTEFANKLMNNVGVPNKTPNTVSQNEGKKEESSKQIKDKENKNNDKLVEKKNDEKKEEIQKEEDKTNKVDENQKDNKEKEQTPENQGQNDQEEVQKENQNDEEQKKEVEKPKDIKEEVKANSQIEEDKGNNDNDNDNNYENTTEVQTAEQPEIPQVENDNQNDEDKTKEQNEDNNVKQKETEEVKIENKNEKKALDSKINKTEQNENIFNKRQSMQIPSISKISLSNQPQKKEGSKKIDNYKMLLAQKFLGLSFPQKKIAPQKKEEDNNNITSKPEENKGETNPTPTPTATPTSTPEPQAEDPQNSYPVSPPPNVTSNPIQNSEEEENSLELNKKEAFNYNEEEKILKENEMKAKTMRKSVQINSITIDDFDFEVVESGSSQNSLIEGFLDPINYDKYLSDLKQQGKKEDPREAFCEGFFIASYPRKDGKVIEKSDGIPALSGYLITISGFIA